MVIVSSTNSCISACQSNTQCYESCISSHWPGVDPNQPSEQSSQWNMPSSTWASSTWAATPTNEMSSQWPQQSSQWSPTPTQSSQWGAPSSAWPSNSVWPSSSGSSWAPGCKYFYSRL